MNVLDFEDVSLSGVPHLSLFGELFCRRGVRLKVEKVLALRYRGNILQVRGVSYNYVAWIPGQHLVLKYHNWHENPDIYIHRAYNPQTGREILYEELARNQFPVLSEVLDEAELLTRRIPG